MSIGTDPREIFSGADWALMVGAQPRGPGMERADLLDLNGRIFRDQGAALNEVASPDVKVLVVGNPCNTNALIAMENAPRIPRKNFHALTRLDENRAKCQLALKSGKFYTNINRVAVRGGGEGTRSERGAPGQAGGRRVEPAKSLGRLGSGCRRVPRRVGNSALPQAQAGTSQPPLRPQIWGNHSTTQVPDFVNARIGGRPAIDVIGDMKWFRWAFLPAPLEGRPFAHPSLVPKDGRFLGLYLPWLGELRSKTMA